MQTVNSHTREAVERLLELNPPDAEGFSTCVTNGDFSFRFSSETFSAYVPYYFRYVLEDCGFPFVAFPNGEGHFPDYSIGNTPIVVRAIDINGSTVFGACDAQELLNELTYGAHDCFSADYVIVEYYDDGIRYHISKAFACKLWEIAHCCFDNGGRKRIVVDNQGKICCSNDNTHLAFGSEKELVDALLLEAAER